MSLVSVERAMEMGKRRGLGAASWAFDGNTKPIVYKTFLEGVEEGDPEVMDAFAHPEWLSGEWAGESLGEILGECEGDDEDRLDDVCQAYEDAASEAYWDELVRVARLHVEGE